jgi:hypothetical protein
MLMAHPAIGILLTLPSTYRFQKGFNDPGMAIHRARTGPLEALKPGQ